MSHDLTAKQRNSSYQHWRSEITRESRDLPALERIGARALQDRDVRADRLLESMIRAEVERYRSDLQRTAQLELQGSASRSALLKRSTATSQHNYTGPMRSRREDWDAESVTLPDTPAPPPASLPTPRLSDVDEATFRRLIEHLSAALECKDEDAARTVCAHLGALHQRRSDIVCTADLEKHEKRIETLHAQLNDHRNQISSLAQQAQTAARGGNAPAALELLRRLTDIHAAHPRMLDLAKLKKMRDDVARANEGHEDGLTTRKFVMRGRAVAADVKRLESAVSEYHRAVFNHPEGSAKFRAASGVYSCALREIRLHEKEWLAEFVLELGDVLASWKVAPRGAAQQIDHFLEQVRGALQRIQVNMGEIDTRRVRQ